MHPRNIYKKPPDFKQLAIDYPEFRLFAKPTLSGKVMIDFKNQEALTSLTKTLLKRDFDLQVEIPKNTLVPTLPLRLNYVLWVEDLLECLVETNVKGVDIGTGASCVYPLLCAKKGWSMLGTEIDPESIAVALKNVENNNLSQLITLKQVENKENILIDVLPDGEFHFCMCNPPFFSDEKDLNFKNKSRSQSRKEPNNAQTGQSCEVVTEGGELRFIRKIIAESKQLGEKVKIYTTMVGQKSNFLLLKNEVLAINPVSEVHTEFHQGKTTRWGLAWTFCNLNLTNVNTKVSSNKKKPQKSKPFIFNIVKESRSMDEIENWFRNKMETLKMTIDEDAEGEDGSAFYIKAFQNTWSNQRRKRRYEKLSQNTEEPDCKKQKSEETNQEAKGAQGDEGPQKEVDPSGPPVLEFVLVLKEEHSGFVVEMSYVSGALGKDGLYQVQQYLKNTWEKKVS